ncbi:uncharacterized protein LOC112568431 [Pomacea canaliculata]|uniref:uncharacterized protein LOC112568431 n=1 Tax=Pomacea canaliculata TaxID=400727 RepID=UPI000D729F6E|nr:uncharacterized protein LOC112568431 [Pomacea canaliculata]
MSSLTNIMARYFLCLSASILIYDRFYLSIYAISDMPRDLSKYQVIKAEDKDEPRVTFHIKADVCNNTMQLCRIKLTTHEAGYAVDKCKFCVQNKSCISSNRYDSCSCIQSEKGDIIYYNDTVHFTASNIQIFFWLATTVSSLETEKPVETVFVIRESETKQVVELTAPDVRCSCPGLIAVTTVSVLSVIVVVIATTFTIRRSNKTKGQSSSKYNISSSSHCSR